MERVNYDENLKTQEKKKIFSNQKLIGIITAVIAVAFIALIILIDCVVLPNQAAQKMSDAFESKEGANVYNVFTEYCGDDRFSYDELSRTGKYVFLEFEDCILNAKNELNSQSKDTDINEYLLDSMGYIILPQEYSAISTIAKYNNELNSVISDYYELYASKISYIKGVEQFNSNDFGGAANSFSNVIEDDSWYNDAQDKMTESQSKLLENKIALIEKYIDSGEYDSAQWEIDNLRNEKLTDDIIEKLNDYETKIYEAKLDKIDEYVNNGDLEGANEYIASLGDGLSGDAQARLDSAIKNKASDYIAKADEALKSGERQGAYDMAVMAQNLCPDDDEISKKVEYFKEYLPFELYLEDNTLLVKNYVTFGMGGIGLKGKSYEANDSSTQKNCINVVSYDEELMAYCQYNLNKKYDTISGKGFIPKEAKNHSQRGYFVIYGDGKKLYTSKTFKPALLPFEFSVDVSGVDILKIEFYNDKDAYCNYGISNFVATKNLPK
ncbi:MAG: NPCBM/NEW2 domain-containing protein [Eubacterium sp.]